jgi:hypothetical protein
MTDRVRIVRHEVVPLYGSYEVHVEPSRAAYSIGMVSPAAACDRIS